MPTTLNQNVGRPSPAGKPPGMGGMREEKYTGNIGFSRATQGLVGSVAMPPPPVQMASPQAGPAQPRGTFKLQPNLRGAGGKMNAVGLGAPGFTTPDIDANTGAPRQLL